MSLPSDLISQLVKVTKDEPQAKSDTITYGQIRKDEETKLLYLHLDGSGTRILLDDVMSTSETAEVNDEDRVMVLIKNHTVTIIGNLTARSVTTSGMQLDRTRIADLETDNVKIHGSLDTHKASIDELDAELGDFKELTTEKIEAAEGEITKINSKMITVEQVSATYATIEGLKATNGDIYNLKSIYASAERMNAAEATIKDLGVTYATIDFSNIGKAAIEQFFATSGLIENVIVGDGTITGTLVGVTIKGDIIEGNTIVADKLVIQGEDGLYYKLNTNGETTESEQTDYNSLNGSIITAKSITATQISVDDLVAFDATIGGFTITDDAIYSEVKDANNNTTRGTHIGADGTVNFGDANRFIKYYRDDAGNWRLVISADTVLYDVNGSPHSLADLGAIGDYVKITSYDNEPCIELGETDSDFKLLITNTRMLFMEGSDIIAHISNQSLHIKKAIIEEELQHGDFVWKVRANGNMGLMWKGGV